MDCFRKMDDPGDQFRGGDPRVLVGGLASGVSVGSTPDANDIPRIDPDVDVSRNVPPAHSPAVTAYHGSTNNCNLFARRLEDTVGLELETVDQDGACSEDDLASNWFYYERDGSLPDGGREVIVDALPARLFRRPSLWYGLANVVGVRGSSWGYRQCGLHVHVGLQSLLYEAGFRARDLARTGGPGALPASLPVFAASKSYGNAPLDCDDADYARRDYIDAIAVNAIRQLVSVVWHHAVPRALVSRIYRRSATYDSCEFTGEEGFAAAFFGNAFTAHGTAGSLSALDVAFRMGYGECARFELACDGADWHWGTARETAEEAAEDIMERAPSPALMMSIPSGLLCHPYPMTAAAERAGGSFATWDDIVSAACRLAKTYVAVLSGHRDDNDPCVPAVCHGADSLRFSEKPRSDRHRELNYCNSGTIEFRLGKGTLNPASILAMVEMSYGLCKYVTERMFTDTFAQLMDPRRVLAYLKDNTTSELLAKEVDKCA